MERQSFLFRKEWCDAVSGLRPNLRLEFLEAVINYGLTGKTPEGLGEVVGLAFGVAKAVIDRDNEELAKKEAASKRNRENVLKRYKKDSAKVVATTVDTTKKSEKAASAPSRAHVVADNNIFNNNINIKNNNQKIEKESQKKENEKPGSEKKEGEKPVNSGGDLKLSKAADYDAQAFIDFFNNELVKANSVIPPCKRLTDKRKHAIQARVRDEGEDVLKTMATKAAASDFLNGHGYNGWIATIDWLLRPNNFVKVVEGNYDNNKISNSNGNSKQQYKIDPRRGTEAIECDPSEYF